MTCPRSRLPLLAAASALALFGSGVALAQPRCIPQSLTQSTTISEAQKQEIARCIDRVKADLASEDPAAIRRARDEMERPLLDPDVSIAFRIEYTRQLLPILEPLAKHERDIVAANALHLAGELATPLAGELLTRVGLRSERPAVRYAAAYGLKRTFEQIQATSSVYQPDDASKVIQSLGGRIGAETDPHVLEGYTRAFEAAAAVPEAKLRGVRATAAQVLAAEMGKRAQNAAGKVEIGPALIRAGQVLRDTMNNPNQPRLPDAVLKEIGGYGGDLLNLVRCTLTGPNAAEADRGELAAIVATGENAYFFAASNLGRSQQQAPSLVQAVRNGKDEEYSAAVDGIVRNLTSPPFGLPASRFQCR